MSDERDIKVGDYIKVGTQINGNDAVELLLEITKGYKLMPDGYFVTDFGIYHPDQCSKAEVEYRGRSDH